MKNIVLPLIFFLVLLWSCDEKSLKKLPTVSTTAPYDIGGESATSGGDVIEDGGAEVTVRGVCWNTIPEPTTSWTCGERGTDNYGFAALAGGVRYHVNGGFYDMGLYSDWWTSTPGYECCITYRDLVCAFNVVGISPGGANRQDSICAA